MEHFEQSSRSTGTSYRGCINVDYSKLVEVFGQPHMRGNGMQLGDKVQAEWCFEFEDGVVFTIYDWKNYQSAEYITDWHIGGFSATNVIDRVEALLKGIHTLPSPVTRG